MISEISLYRDGLCEILGQRDEIEVLGGSPRVDVALRSLRRMAGRPDIVLIDIGSPSGVSALQQLAGAVPGVKIVAITVPDSVADVIACAECGASGFVTRDASLEQLVSALEGVVRGEVLCSPRITAALLRHVSSLAQERAPTTALTQREQEILSLIDAGMSNKAIARQLCIELPTVKNHVHRIIAKLGVENRAQAAARARGAPAAVNPLD